MTLLEHLVKVWRAKTARHEMHHRLLIVIDARLSLSTSVKLKSDAANVLAVSSFVVTVLSAPAVSSCVPELCICIATGPAG